MLRALGSTCIAHFSAKLADPLREFRSPRHFARREGADVRATPVEFNAPRHRLDFIFVQASCGAVFAGFHTFMASFNAGSVFLV